MSKAFLGYTGPSLKKDKVYKEIYAYWKKNKKNIRELSEAMIIAVENDYGIVKQKLDDLAFNLEGRILIALTDGTVKYDSFKGEMNSWKNYKAKQINENHNTRVSIISAQLSRNFFGAEIKFSTSDNRIEAYLAKTIRPKYGNNLGTVRLSKKEPYSF